MVKLGVDLGGTTIKAGLVEEGQICVKATVPTGANEGPEAVLKRIAALCHQVAGARFRELESIGVGSPGILSADGSNVIYAGNLGFHRVELARGLEQLLNLPVSAENDANCAALGESLFGAAAGCRNVVLLTLGTGVGGGVIVDGKILSGTHCSAAELGHMTIQMDGERCTCGRRGCLEAYTSATALIRDTRRAMERCPDSAMWHIAAENRPDTSNFTQAEILTLVNGKTAFDAAREGDPAGTRVVSAYIHALAEGIANLINIFRPEKVLLGGGISHSGDELILPLEREVTSLVFGSREGVSIPPILRATLGNDAGIIGAAML